MKVRPAAQRGTVSSEGRQQEILAKTPRPQRNIRTNLGGLCVSWRPWRESGSQPQPQHIARRSNGISTTADFRECVAQPAPSGHRALPAPKQRVLHGPLAMELPELL